ncbi:MAG: 1,4-dihydroxy-2-naphthoate octaprenyltransferase [Muribaculaceae bacterium]|nr:1,4-dihydroxy-2-naphthoate octaprenyltransferase [Muribaculaceae bacterium]MDE5858053.1 1,4-dihydroxy-2-naphthoate octaprenyltransferase [Muribaculaceae bacterium]
MIKAWIEAMRLRTLPVSLAGVAAAWGVAMTNPAGYSPKVVIACCLFALLCQISSNFANEYFDFKNGLDRPGREGPRRGVTEGDITPSAMRNATFITLVVACLIGLWIAWQGGWWLIAAGIVIALGVIAYSSGPYPLSHHGLGEVAVIFFFGIIPVNLTVYVATGYFMTEALLLSVAIGLMGANVLIVNNYRDIEDDRAVNKRTLAVILGQQSVAKIYMLNGLISQAVMIPVWDKMASGWIISALYLLIHVILWRMLISRQGASLTPVLGMTAVTMFLFSLLFVGVALLT